MREKGDRMPRIMSGFKELLISNTLQLGPNRTTKALNYRRTFANKNKEGKFYTFTVTRKKMSNLKKL